MPFTFAHPAIVLPIRKCRWFSFSALVFGSMAPDFEYFFRMQPFSVYSHTLVGLLLFDLPIAILLAVLYHCVVKEPLIARVPEWIGRGLLDANNGLGKLPVWRFAMVFVYSALLGSFSHIAWDSFTHKGTRMVETLLWLQRTISIGHYEVPVYKLLQHGSTLLGGLAILYVIARNGRQYRHVSIRQVSTRAKWMFWFGVAWIGLLTVFLHAYLVKGVSPFLTPLQQVVPFLSGAMLGMIVLCGVIGSSKWNKE